MCKMLAINVKNIEIKEISENPKENCVLEIGTIVEITKKSYENVLIKIREFENLDLNLHSVYSIPTYTSLFEFDESLYPYLLTIKDKISRTQFVLQLYKCDPHFFSKQNKNWDDGLAIGDIVELKKDIFSVNKNIKCKIAYRGVCPERGLGFFFGVEIVNNYGLNFKHLFDDFNKKYTKKPNCVLFTIDTLIENSITHSSNINVNPVLVENTEKKIKEDKKNLGAIPKKINTVPNNNDKYYNNNKKNYNQPKQYENKKSYMKNESTSKIDEKKNHRDNYKQTQDECNEKWVCVNCTYENNRVDSECYSCKSIRKDNLSKSTLDNHTYGPVNHVVRETNSGKYDYTKFKSINNEDPYIKNKENEFCSLCKEPIKCFEGVLIRACKHPFCKECLIEKIKNCVEAGISCPFKGSYICDKDLDDREIKALGGVNLYENVLANRLKEFSRDNIFYTCVNPECKATFINDSTENNITCLNCKENNCLICQKIHSNTLNCQEAEIIINDKNEEFKCLICDNMIDIKNLVRLQNCNHEICHQCLKQSLDYQAKQQLMFAKCPQCFTELTENEIKIYGNTKSFNLPQNENKDLNQNEFNKKCSHLKNEDCFQTEICKHKFCISCIQDAFNEQTKSDKNFGICPECLSELTEQDINSLFSLLLLEDTDQEKNDTKNLVKNTNLSVNELRLQMYKCNLCESNNDLLTLKCQHCLCNKCITIHFISSNEQTCPICKINLTEKEISKFMNSKIKKDEMIFNKKNQNIEQLSINDVRLKNKCSLCDNNNDLLTLNNCQHNFCKYCIVEHLKNQQSGDSISGMCPTCFKKLNDEEFYKLISLFLINEGTNNENNKKITTIKCLNSECCSNIQINSDETLDFIDCSKCKKIICLNCKSLHNKDVSCIEYEFEKRGLPLISSLLSNNENGIIQQLECGLCDNKINAKDLFILQECLHNFCKSCLFTKIKNSNSVIIPCPFNKYECNEFLQLSEIEILKQEMKNLESIKEKKLFNECFNKKCNGIFDGSNDSDGICFICKTKNCIKCKAIHLNLTCAQYKKKLQEKFNRIPLRN